MKVMRAGLIFGCAVWMVLGISTTLRATPSWTIGTLLKVEKRVESTPRTYVWDVVVTSTDVITYRLHVRVGQQVYVTDYTPDVQPSGLPASWQVGNALRIRVEKPRLFIRTTYGEITTYIRGRK